MSTNCEQCRHYKFLTYAIGRYFKLEKKNPSFGECLMRLSKKED